MTTKYKGNRLRNEIRVHRGVELNYWKTKDTTKSRSRKLEAHLQRLDKQYSIVVHLFMSEIEKRKINLDSATFNESMEEILQDITQGNFFKNRFPNANMDEVRKTILRRINAERQKEGKGREDE